MKKDLLTTIVAAVIGLIVAYALIGVFIPEIKSVSFKTLSSNTTYNIVDPNPEVFNYRAINPTVEVYVGQCKEYNAAGECVSEVTLEEEQEQNPENNTENSTEQNPEQNPDENSENTPEPSPETPDQETENGTTD